MAKKRTGILFETNVQINIDISNNAIQTKIYELLAIVENIMKFTDARQQKLYSHEAIFYRISTGTIILKIVRKAHIHTRKKKKKKGNERTVYICVT